MHGSLRPVRLLAAIIAVAVLALTPTAAQADPSFYETPLFGVSNAPGGALYVADAGKGIVNADTGALVAALPGVNDVAAKSHRDILAVVTGPQTGVFRVSNGTATFIADTAAFESTVDPAGDGTEEGSNPFDLARLPHKTALVADAAGNSLLVVDGHGQLDWVATFPQQHGIQSVPTSVAVGPDGAYYVGELTGAPFPTGISRVWRIAPGTRHADCATSPACAVVITGRTAIIDLQFGPDGKLYVAQLDDAGVGAFESGAGVGGSVQRCDVTTGACEQVVAGIPILTAIAFRGGHLWGSILALVPGSADVVPIA
jgi:DNA-binding beta-propeller fold protein YncE